MTSQDRNIAKAQQQEYISIDEAATELGVSRSNLYYYIRQLPDIELKKFSLDRRSYISRSDVARIKAARVVGAGSARIASEDVLVFLAGLGLAITPHSDPDVGWGYSWFDGDWNGPYPSPIDTIKVAFEQAEAKSQRLSNMPFPTQYGELFWWDGEDWYGARHRAGQLEIRTFNDEQNEYEPLARVIERRDAWLQPETPTGNRQIDEEHEQARLAALWLTSAIRGLQYVVEPIDWQHDGLHAEVIVNNHHIGDLLTVYNHLRQEESFLAWLRPKLSNIVQFAHQDRELRSQ